MNSQAIFKGINSLTLYYIIFNLYIKGSSIYHITKLNAYKILLLVFNSRFFLEKMYIEHAQNVKYRSWNMDSLYMGKY